MQLTFTVDARVFLSDGTVRGVGADKSISPTEGAPNKAALWLEKKEEVKKWLADVENEVVRVATQNKSAPRRYTYSFFCEDHHKKLFNVELSTHSFLGYGLDGKVLELVNRVIEDYCSSIEI